MFVSAPKLVVEKDIITSFFCVFTNRISVYEKYLKGYLVAKRERFPRRAHTRKLPKRGRLPQRRPELKAAVTFMRATSLPSSTSADMPRRLHHSDSEVNGKLHFHVPGPRAACGLMQIRLTSLARLVSLRSLVYDAFKCVSRAVN